MDLVQQGYNLIGGDGMNAFLDKLTGHITVNSNIEVINLQPNNVMYLLNTNEGYKMVGTVNYADISSGKITYLKAIILTKFREIIQLGEWDIQNKELLLKYGVGAGAGVLVSLYNKFNMFRSVAYSVMLYSETGELRAIFKSASEAVNYVKTTMINGERFIINIVAESNNEVIVSYNNIGEEIFRTKVYVNNDIRCLYDYYASSKMIKK